MKLEKPKLRQILAGEYALGALQGRARRHFERLMQTDAELRRLVGEWQDDLAPLSMETPPVAPAPHVLDGIERRIGGAARERQTWWNRLGFWRAFGLGSAAAAIVLAVFSTMLVLRPPDSLSPSYVAVLQNSAGQPALVVTGYRAPFRLRTEPIVMPSPPKGQVLQIWAIERETGTIRPLARARPDAPSQVALGADAWQLVRSAQALAVSVEPPGTTPAEPSTGLLYSGVCINLKGS